MLILKVRWREIEGTLVWTSGQCHMCVHTHVHTYTHTRGQTRRRKKPFNYVFFLCFSRGKIGRAETEKALFKEEPRMNF